jgi:acyl-coenzyme A synthetase/AMP-(fatty) acid ligase
MFGPLFEALANQSTIMYPLATTPPSSSSMAEALKYTNADTAVLAPPMVVEIASNPELLEFLAKKIDIILFGGGDLPQSFGDIITSRFRFYTSNGSTETAPYPLIRPAGPWPREDWKWNRVHPGAGLEYQHQIDDLYEAVIVRNPKKEHEQPVFKIFPELQEYRTKDLFSKHPTKPHLWTYRGRADDMINLSSGTINPTAMDHQVTDHPKVRDGLMVPVGKHARERFASQTGILIELKDGEEVPEAEKQTFIDEIWALVEQANEKYRPEARIEKARILLTDPKKPFPRNAKGLVQRNVALELYADELEAI